MPRKNYFSLEVVNEANSAMIGDKGDRGTIPLSPECLRIIEGAKTISNDQIREAFKEASKEAKRV